MSKSEFDELLDTRNPRYVAPFFPRPFQQIHVEPVGLSLIQRLLDDEEVDGDCPDEKEFFVVLAESKGLFANLTYIDFLWTTALQMRATGNGDLSTVKAPTEAEWAA